MNIKKLLLTSGVLLTLDAIFLNFTKSIFNKMVKNIQGSDIKINLLMLPLVYITVTLQIYYFIINKNASVFEAFLLGFLTYSIFDLTNYINLNKCIETMNYINEHQNNLFIFNLNKQIFTLNLFSEISNN